MTERKADLERRINMLQGEREGLSSTLDESADRILMLEKQSREQDSLVWKQNVENYTAVASITSVSDPQQREGDGRAPPVERGPPGAP